MLEGRPEAELRDLLSLALEGAARPAGRLFALPPSTPADLLSLRALQVLSSTDVLVVEPGGCDEVAALARREARRLPPAEAGPGEVAALLAEGRTVVLLVNPAPWQAAGLSPSDLPVAPGV